MTAWRPVDCHAHSTFSDGALTVPQVVARAAALGGVPSVTDHASNDVAAALGDLEAIEAYLDALETQPVLRGAEFCWHDGLWRQVPSRLARRFTHTVGSLHAIALPGGEWQHAFARAMPATVTAASYMEALVATAERMAAEMPVDVLAHPTLVTLAFRATDPLELWSEELEGRLVHALARAGIAFEVSNRYRPHARLVERAAAEGCRLSLGSDGHGERQVADVAWPLALTRAVGVPDADLYDPRAHGSRQLGHRA